MEALVGRLGDLKPSLEEFVPQRSNADTHRL